MCFIVTEAFMVSRGWSFSPAEVVAGLLYWAMILAMLILTIELKALYRSKLSYYYCLVICSILAILQSLFWIGHFCMMYL